MVPNDWSKKCVNCLTPQSWLSIILRDNFYFGDFFHLWAQVIGTFPFFQPKIIQLPLLEPMTHFVKYKSCHYYLGMHKTFVLLLLWLVVTPQVKFFKGFYINGNAGAGEDSFFFFFVNMIDKSEKKDVNWPSSTKLNDPPIYQWIKYLRFCASHVRHTYRKF